MLKTILLFPVAIVLAAITSLTAYNVMALLTVFVGRGVGFAIRSLLRMKIEWTDVGAVFALVVMLCSVLFPLLIFVGMLWTWFGGEAGFFLTGLSIVTPTWFGARFLTVLVTGEPSAARRPIPGDAHGRQGWRRLLRRSTAHPTGVLAHRSYTTAPPEGVQSREGMVFVRFDVLKWSERRGPHVETRIEELPRKQVFGKDTLW